MLRPTLLAAGLLLLPGSAPGQVFYPSNAPTAFDTAVVSVFGEGRAFARPDRAVLFAEIVSEEAMAEAALTTNGDRRSRIVSALAELGYDVDDLSLWGYGTGRGGDPFGPPQSRSAGETYEARSGLRIVVDDLERLDLVASAILVAGATALTVELESDGLETARREAGEMAVRAARAEAEALATAAGGRLGDLLTITSSPTAVASRGAWSGYYLMSGGPRDERVSIAPNDVLVRASVQATWVFVEGR
jgi:hypothetical protein